MATFTETKVKSEINNSFNNIKEQRKNMEKVKYCVTEFTPNENQVGMSHSWSAKCVINNDIPGGNG